jgi:hypothetical protein
MKPKGLLIAVALLAVLGGGVWWSNKNEAKKSASKSDDKTTKVLTIPDDQLQEIRVEKPGVETVALARNAAGKWQLTAPRALPADQDTAGQVAGAVASVTSDKLIEEGAANLAPYGLDHPQMTVTVKRKDGKTDTLLVGDETPTGTGNYFKLCNDARVFTLATSSKTSFDKTANDLRDKRLLTFDSDKLTRVEINAKKQVVEFGKNNQNEWQILKPRPLRADGSQVEELIRKLKDAKMDLTVSDEDAKKAADGFAGAAKVATATVADAGGNQTLEVRKDKDKNYLAKSSVVEGVFKVASDLGEGLDKSADDFRNKKLFDFGFNDPNKVEVNQAAYTKSGEKWIRGGKTMDSAAVQNLIDKLRDLSSIKFLDKGAGDTVVEALVTSGDGKRVEKVVITKQGNQFFALREHEPGIYELDSVAVESLQKAAADVKEAKPEAKKK